MIPLSITFVEGITFTDKGTDITVHIQTSTLPPNLRNKTLITVDGKAMRIRDQNQVGDGAITKILCEVVK